MDSNSDSMILQRQSPPFAAKFAFIIVSLLTAAGLGCSSNTATGQQPQGPQAVPVKVQTVRALAVSSTTDYVATLKSRNSAVIMPEVEGRITQIYVHSGDHVSAGARLLQIDPSKQQATVNSQQHNRAAQEANLAYAKQQFDRSSGLYAAGVISKQDMDQAKSAYDAAVAEVRSLDAQVEEQQVQLHYYSVVAPSNGIVGDIPVRVGDRVTTATTLTTVDKPGSLEAYVYIPIERSPDLKMGMPVQILDSAGKVIADSRVTFISPEVDNTTQTVLVKATIANNRDKLRTAQFIRARVVWGTEQSPVIPVLAVTRLGGQFFAFVAEEQNGKAVAHQKALKVGDMVGNDYAVLDGIKPGDKVIVSGTQFLLDGMPIIPQT
ncbi:MAG TPA: efflux RND transporter periplasmic adaptor subunit [Terriglobales bacterium]|nr:efflux RND transporter periplasmic adaptor subunit [Terriglobales bacterium]